MRDRLIALKLKRDKTAKEIASLQKYLASAEPAITPEKIKRVARLLHEKLHSGSAEFQQAYARLLLDDVRVTHEDICISGSKAVLARAAAQDADVPAPAVLFFLFRTGAPEGIRTPGLCLRRQILHFSHSQHRWPP